MNVLHIAHICTQKKHARLYKIWSGELPEQLTYRCSQCQTIFRSWLALLRAPVIFAAPPSAGFPTTESYGHEETKLLTKMVYRVITELPHYFDEIFKNCYSRKFWPSKFSAIAFTVCTNWTPNVFPLKTSTFNNANVRSSELRLSAQADNPCVILRLGPSSHVFPHVHPRSPDVIQVISEPRPS